MLRPVAKAKGKGGHSTEVSVIDPPPAFEMASGFYGLCVAASRLVLVYAGAERAQGDGEVSGRARTEGRGTCKRSGFIVLNFLFETDGERQRSCRGEAVAGSFSFSQVTKSVSVLDRGTVT